MTLDSVHYKLEIKIFRKIFTRWVSMKSTVKFEIRKVFTGWRDPKVFFEI